MQAVLEEQGSEVSDSCKAEIKNAIETDQRARMAAQGRNAPRAAAPKADPPLIPPALILFTFIVAALGGVGYYVYTEHKTNPRSIPATRSRKKEERDRRRGR